MLIIEDDHAGTPGNSFYTIISGGKILLEIYDQAPALKRTFNEVSEELADVIEHHTSIEKSKHGFKWPVADTRKIAAPGEPKLL